MLVLFQMEHVQRLYRRLKLEDPGHCQVNSTAGLPSLLRPRMKRSHTFAATSGTSSLSAAVHKSSPQHSSPSLEQQPRVNGHGAASHTPELNNDVEDQRSHQANYETIAGYEDQTALVFPHPSRPLAYSYPMRSGESGNVGRRVAGRKHGWTSSTNPMITAEPTRKADKEKEEDEASSSGVSSNESSSDYRHDHHDHHHHHHLGGREGRFKSTASKPADLEQQDGGGSPKRGRVDILQLCQHLRTQGLGEPVMSTYSHTGQHANSLPPGVRARCLPRDPSTREKIKGRARLDYELANMRAVAFCEQQRPRTFRTASADLRNRDVRLLEEEEREHLHKELNTAQGGLEQEDDDDASSLVGSPLSREELFFRIEAWAEEVHKATHHHGHS